MALGEYEDAIYTTLTLPRTQYGATQGKPQKRNRIYASSNVRVNPNPSLSPVKLGSRTHKDALERAHAVGA